jgi:hypothetical protein
MKAKVILATLVGVVAIGGPTTIYSAEKFDFGKREYDSSCAVCHGGQGKGDGAYAGILDKRIPELNTLAKKNGGVFPTQRVTEIIDGRQAVKTHGPRDMPIWGDRYLKMAGESYMEVPYDSELFVRTRVISLTDYINRLQQK